MATMSVEGIINLVIGFVMAIIFLVVGITLGPTFTYYIGFLNSTSMASVQLGTVIVLFAEYGPLFYYLTLVGGAILMIIGVMKVRPYQS